jgi:hypothetical protein
MTDITYSSITSFYFRERLHLLKFSFLSFFLFFSQYKRINKQLKHKILVKLEQFLLKKKKKGGGKGRRKKKKKVSMQISDKEEETAVVKC